jgi:hypothetical protein
MRGTRATIGQTEASRLILKGQKLVIDQDIVTPHEMERSRYYNELVGRTVCDGLLGSLSGRGRHCGGYPSSARPRKVPFEANDKLVLVQLSRPLTEIASLSAAVGRISLSSATNALNAVRQPAIAIDRLGFVLDANPAADALFDENIRRSNSRLVVGDAGDAEAGICLKKLTDRLRITPIRRRSPVSRSSFADERKVPSSCASCRFTVPHELRFSARGCFSRLRPSSPSMGQTRLCSEEPAG